MQFARCPRDRNAYHIQSSRLTSTNIIAHLTYHPLALRRRRGQNRVAMVQSRRLPSALPYSDQVAIFSRLEQANPRPETELVFSNPYTLVVAVALSAQATDVGVNKATKGLFALADTPERMLELGLEGVTSHIKTIGLYRQKAKNVIALSQILVDEYGGQVPDSRAALMSLPGVGRKTANVVLNCAFGHQSQAVDTHIFRVGNRTRIAPGRDVNEVERAIEDNVPVRFQRHAHHWIILHGRYICQARRPRCAVCIIADLCPFEEKTI